MIALDLSKQQALDANPKPIQQINFTLNLDREGYRRMFFIIEEANESILDFSEGPVKVLQKSPYDLATACFTILFYFNIISI